MNISLRYRYDGSQLCAPIGAMVDSASTPVQVPVAIDAELQIEVVSAWTRRPVSPARDMTKASDWRFAIFDRYGDGNGMVFATRTVQTTASGWLVPWKDSGTAEMYEALGEDKARIFVAELQGYESSASALPISVLSFPFRVGNRRGDIVTISPLETFTELDPVATKLLETHEARRDNPHGVTAKQVGALPLSGGKVEDTVSYAPYAPEGAISTSYDGEILAHGNVIHLTTPDSSESPSAWGSGLLSGIPGGSVCPLTVIIENTGDAAQTFTLMNDALVAFKFNSGYETSVPCSELAPGAFCFVNLLVWKRSPKTLAFVREYYRTDKVNNAGIMSPTLFSYGGKAFRLEVDENGVLTTTLAG